MIPFFDGHNDLLSRMASGACTVQDVQNGYGSGHIDLPRARRGGLGGGFFAVFVEEENSNLGNTLKAMAHPPYHLNMPTELPHIEALPRALHQIALLQRLQHQGIARVCTNIEGLETSLHNPDHLSAVLHLEGAEAIDDDFHSLEVLYAAGLRSLGITWSRPNRFGNGAPFAYPATPDFGNGLTDLGQALLSACNQLGIMLDVAHLNAQGFDDVARISTAPLVVTHSNAHHCTPHARNLTDRQLQQIRERDGLVGVTFATAMLRADGAMNPETGFEPLLRHLDYLLERLGEDRVAFGSDFDGATIPNPIGDCAGLTQLDITLSNAGIDDALKAKLYHRNWLRILRATWH